MEAILPGHQVSDEDSYNQFLRRKGPAVVADFLDGAGDFATHLRRITPIGAPAMRCWADREPEPCPLPLIKPPAMTGPVFLRESDWMVRALESIKVDGKTLREVERTAELLAPGPRRPTDGLPAWWSHLEPAWAGNWQPNGPQVTSQRKGRARRDILAAVCTDLHGRPLSWVSGTVLGLKDHEGFSKGGRFAKEPRNARRYQARGRSLLSALGAWPWALATQGRLEPTWREDRSYTFSLECWASHAMNDLRQDIARTSRSLSALSRAKGDRYALLCEIAGVQDQ